jgi:hypothetical protein
MAIRKREPFELVTMGHIRGHGCRDLLVYCSSAWCNHSAKLNDWLGDQSLPDEERERRKRRLTKGPSEFRDMRGDIPKPKG